MKTLTAYFSYSGNTERIAEEAAKKTGSDLFEIKPVHPYTQADVNWQDDNSRNVREYKDPSARPAIAEKTDLSAYDTVYLGFPVWWYTNPRIINTFLESYDFTGKKVIPFITSGGTPVAGVVKALRETYPQIDFADGMRISNDRDIDKLIQA